MALSNHLDVWLAIGLAAVATYGLRAGGLLLAERLPKTGRLRRGMDALPGALLEDSRFCFATPASLPAKLKPAGEVDVPKFMSWEDNGNDLTTWLGNDMQKDAIHALYSLAARVRACGQKMLLHDYERLQTADHFRYMSTRWFSGPRQDRPNPFDSPYDAYITYMNVLADFELRLDAAELTSKTVKTRRTSRSTLSSGTGASA